LGRGDPPKKIIRETLPLPKFGKGRKGFLEGRGASWKSNDQLQKILQIEIFRYDIKSHAVH